MRWNLAVAGLAGSWGIISVIVAGVDLDARALVFWRLGLAALTVLAILAAARRLDLVRLPERAWRVAVVGALLGLHWFLFFETIRQSSVAVAVLTVYTAPIFLAALAPLFLPEQRSRVALVALAPAAAGLVLIAVAGDAEGGAVDPLAVALGLAAAVTYAALVIATKRLTHSLEPPTIAFWNYAVAAVCLAPFLLGVDRVTPEGAELALIPVLGVVFTALSGLLYIWLLRRVTAQAIGILAFLEPVSAALLAWATSTSRCRPPCSSGARSSSPPASSSWWPSRTRRPRSRRRPSGPFRRRGRRSKLWRRGDAAAVAPRRLE